MFKKTIKLEKKKICQKKGKNFGKTKLPQESNRKWLKKNNKLIMKIKVNNRRKLKNRLYNTINSDGGSYTHLPGEW